MCPVTLTSGWIKWLNTPTLEGVAHASSHHVPGLKLAFRAGFYPFSRVTLVLGPLHGYARSSHSISVEHKAVTQKIDAWAGTPISHPQSYEFAISNMKRGRVEVTMAGCILQASLVWSAPLPLECQHQLPHIPGPSTSNFSPLIQQGHSRKCLKDSTKLPVHPT